MLEGDVQGLFLKICMHGTCVHVIRERCRNESEGKKISTCECMRMSFVLEVCVEGTSIDSIRMGGRMNSLG